MLFFTSLLLVFNAYAQQNVENQNLAKETSSADLQFIIERTEPQNHLALVKYNEEQAITIGKALKIKTQDGTCVTPVEKIVPGFFYIRTEQCERKNVQKGTIVVLEQTQTVVQQVLEASSTQNSHGESVSVINYDNEFVQDYIQNKLSALISYNMSQSLGGSLALDNQTSIHDLSGANTLSVAADYKFLDLPQNLSLSAGASLSLPRSYGKYGITTTNGVQTSSLSHNPVLTSGLLSLNLRYQMVREFIFFLGANRMLATMDNVPGSVSGDFGFHSGVRYYPHTQLFVEGSLNFYNLNYTLAGKTTDLSLNELEIKGGYTF